MGDNMFENTVILNESAGNIYFLKGLYGLPFTNTNKVDIDDSLIELWYNNNNNDFFFHTGNQNITPVLIVKGINTGTLENTIQQLNSFKQSLPDVNFFQIVGK